MESSGPSKKAIISLVVIVLLVVAATAVVVASGNKNNTVADGRAPSPSTSVSTSPSASSSSSFKDGTYTATGTYDSPGGTQSIDVRVTLAGGVITDTSVTEHPIDSNAQSYQDQFVSAYKSQVVGKKITNVNLSRVAGSSLTSIGFNSAIADIENQAKA